MDVAWIAAVGAVLGALVGATAGGIVDWFLDRARDHRRALVAARLLRRDLWSAASTLMYVEKRGIWHSGMQLPFPAWERYGDALAGSLPPDDYEHVSEMVQRLIDLDRSFRLVVGKDTPLDDEMRDGIAGLRSQTGHAYNRLAELAKLGREPVTDPAFQALDDDGDTEQTSSPEGLSRPTGEE